MFQWGKIAELNKRRVNPTHTTLILSGAQQVGITTACV